MMTCRGLYGFLDDFLDGSLDAEARRSFENHIEKCPACRRYLTTYRTTLQVARKSECADEPAGADAPEALIRAILAARSGGPVPR